MTARSRPFASRRSFVRARGWLEDGSRGKRETEEAKWAKFRLYRQKRLMERRNETPGVAEGLKGHRCKSWKVRLIFYFFPECRWPAGRTKGGDGTFGARWLREKLIVFPRSTPAGGWGGQTGGRDEGPAQLRSKVRLSALLNEQARAWDRARRFQGPFSSSCIKLALFLPRCRPGARK